MACVSMWVHIFLLIAGSLEFGFTRELLSLRTNVASPPPKSYRVRSRLFSLYKLTKSFNCIVVVQPSCSLARSGSIQTGTRRVPAYNHHGVIHTEGYYLPHNEVAKLRVDCTDHHSATL